MIGHKKEQKKVNSSLIINLNLIQLITVISSWKEHIPNRNRTPQPDLVSMNKLATSK